MADTGWKIAGTGAFIAGAGIDWTNASNITANDATQATVTLETTESSDILKGTNFDLTAIPSGATIDGVAVRITAELGGVGTVDINTGRLNMDDDTGSAGSVAFSPNQITSFTESNFDAGNGTQLWGEILTRAITQDIDFGARVSMANNGISQYVVEVDTVEMRVWYTTESLAAAGTVVGATEAQIVAGGRTIILTLTGATWVAAGATFDAQRANIKNGITSGGSQDGGWDEEVIANMAVSRVVRTSNTVVTITLNATECEAYAIYDDETLSASIPATATSSTGALADANFGTITAQCDQNLAPDTIAVQTNLTGAVTDIDESPDSPDANWLLAP